MTKHLGDFDTSAVVYGKFTTFRPSTGAAFTLGGTPALSVYKDNSTTQSTTGVTLTADFDSVTGLNHFAIDTSADGAFYSSGSFFDIVITTGTVDSVSVVGAVVGSFTLRKNSSLKPATAGRTIVVDASGLADANMVKAGPTGSGTAQTARDLGLSLFPYTGTASAGSSSSLTLVAPAPAVTSELKGQVLTIISGTGAGQSRLISGYTSGRVASVSPSWTTTPDNTSVYVVGGSLHTDVRQISGGSGWSTNFIAAYDGTGYAGGTIKQDVNTVTAAGTAWNSGAIGASTLATDTITAAKIAADAIGASELAADAVTEIATGVWANATRTVSAATNITSTGGTVPITAGGLVSSDVTAISTDTTAANNAESFFDGTGYAGTNNVIPTVTTVTNGVTVTTNNDKTGYALSSAGVQAIWDALTSALTTVGSIGKLLVDNINATISSRLASASYTAPDNAGITQIQSDIAALNDISAADVLAAGDIDGYSLEEAQKLQLAAMAGKVSGAATTTVTIKAADDSKARITATVDSDGNRSALTLDASG